MNQAISTARWRAKQCANATGCRSVVEFMRVARAELVAINAERARAGEWKFDEAPRYRRH